MENVSVIIPLYNRSDYILKTVNSVINQTYTDFRLYVIDDGSTDNSKEIVSNIKDPRIEIHQHPGGVNKGQSAAINLGLSLANGKYIAILDSDDLWLENKLEIQVAYLESNLDIGLVYCNGIAIDENNEFLYEIYEEGHEESSNPERVLTNCYFLLPNNSLVRSSIYKKIGGFNENYRAAQDHDMAIRIAEVTKIAFINTLVFAYRRHQNSISHKNAKLRWKNGFKILEAARKRYNYSKKAIRIRRAVLNFRLGQCELEEKKYLSAIMYFVLSGVNDPTRALNVLFGKEGVTSPH